MTALNFVPLEVHEFKTHTEQFITAKGRCTKKLVTESSLLDLLFFFFSIKQRLLLPLCCIKKKKVKQFSVILDFSCDSTEIRYDPLLF